MSEKSEAQVVVWDGQHLPPELNALPPGRYTIEAVEDWALPPDEEASLEAGFASLDRGEGQDASLVAARARARIAARRAP